MPGNLIGYHTIAAVSPLQGMPFVESMINVGISIRSTNLLNVLARCIETTEDGLKVDIIQATGDDAEADEVVRWFRCPVFGERQAITSADFEKISRARAFAVQRALPGEGSREWTPEKIREAVQAYYQTAAGGFPRAVRAELIRLTVRQEVLQYLDFTFSLNDSPAKDVSEHYRDEMFQAIEDQAKRLASLVEFRTEIQKIAVVSPEANLVLPFSTWTKYIGDAR